MYDLVSHPGTTYDSGLKAFPVQSNVTHEALNASEFQAIMYKMFGDRDLITVSRNSVPNPAMGFTYTIEFIGDSVGGKLNLLKPVLTYLTNTAVASNTLKVGDLCKTTTAACTRGSYSVSTTVLVKETQVGAQLQGVFP